MMHTDDARMSREVAEPEVFIKDVPSSVLDADIKESLKNIKTISYSAEVQREDPSKRNIRILLSTPRAMEQCLFVLNGYGLQMQSDGMSLYKGLSVEVPAGVDADDASLLSAISSCIPGSTTTSIAKQITMNTNRQAFVNFLSYEMVSCFSRVYVQETSSSVRMCFRRSVLMADSYRTRSRSRSRTHRQRIDYLLLSILISLLIHPMQSRSLAWTWRRLSLKLLRSSKLILPRN
jgi:hypothetical protein